MKIFDDIRIITLTGILALTVQTADAAENGLLQSMMEERQQVVESVVMYPEQTRNAIFNAATYPDAIIRVGNLQNHTRKNFESLIAEYDQENQQKLYELSRYPGLVAGIAEDGFQMSDLEGYPEEIHGVASEYGAGDKVDTLEALHRLNQESEAAFHATLVPFPADIQQSLGELVSQPQVLETLLENIDLTTALGDAYSENPDAVEARAAELHDRAVLEKEQSSLNWAASFGDDPVVLEEMEVLASQYQQEDDRPEYVYTGPQTVTVNYVYHPYSYWYGYPRWYRHAHWHHYPTWYHTGFYVSSNGTVVIIDAPSYAYTTWYYDEYYYHPHYRHLSLHIDRQVDIDIDLQKGEFFDAARDWKERNGEGRQTLDGERLSGNARETLAGRPENIRQAAVKERNVRPNLNASEQLKMRAADFHQRAWSSRSGGRGGRLAGRVRERR